MKIFDSLEEALEKNFFLSLSLKVESFTAFIALPNFIYFLYVIGMIKQLPYLSNIYTVGIIQGIFTILLGVGYRYFVLKRIFLGIRLLKSGSLNLQESIKLKEEILFYPIKEMKMLILRWIVGYPGGVLLNFLLFSHISSKLIFMGSIGILFTMPISQVLFFFLSEQYMRRLLRMPALMVVEIPENRVLNLGYFRRIAYSIFSVAIIPITLLGFFLFNLDDFKANLEYPILHIFVLFFNSLVAMTLVAYVVARSIRETIAQNNSILLELSKGNFRVLSSRTTLDELGLQGYFLGIVIQKLRDFVNEIQTFNKDLEKKIDERTSELKESLGVITGLKEQQDADYYLTSMLLIPLSKNNSENKFFEFKYLVNQFKLFQFYGKQYEIGGDLCRADDLYLFGREYTLFLASDAMGKSIQGAGGALVLGAVYDSLVQRTKNDNHLKTIPPEVWLKSSFIDLQRVFESFQGAMLISIVMGLVDVHTGTIYFINADHPRTVLFRNGNAEFFEDNSSYYKLGSLFDHNFISVSIREIHEGDSLIFGSDGRDDVFFKNGEEWERNYDQDYFLKIVERGKGDIERISQILQNEYRITDDLSLMSIRPKPGWKSILTHWKSYSEEEDLEKWGKAGLQELLNRKWNLFREVMPNPHFLRNIVLPLIQKKSFSDALECAIYSVRYRILDNELHFYISFCLRKLKKFEESIVWGEILRVRDPYHIRNLFNLIESYFQNGDHSSVEKIFKHVHFLVLEKKLTDSRWKERFGKLEKKIGLFKKKVKLPLTLDESGK
ncbi:MAG: SpoIIE family protein phosphatase [Leptospiraceae bacterium]|nr:SpoIIE family protein phosphatase [Leptospiraceae bacterium]MCP5511670.1 SpoIIE family protein phosphatase [Leptospiraceae bacterium]